MRTVIASTFGAAMLAASSLAFAADNNNTGMNNNNDANTPRDAQTTGSVNAEGRTPSPEFREFCNTNPSDSMCQGLGGEMNQQ